MTITVREFESQVFAVERIRIVVRANPNDSVKEYDYSMAADRTWSVSELIENRLRNYLESGTTVEVISPSGSLVHGGTRLSTIRDNYLD